MIRFHQIPTCQTQSPVMPPEMKGLSDSNLVGLHDFATEPLLETSRRASRAMNNA